MTLGRIGCWAALLAAGAVWGVEAQTFAFDSASLVVTEGRSAPGRTAADLRTTVKLNMHRLAFVAAGYRSAIVPGATVLVNLTVTSDGAVTVARLVESTIGDSAANAAVVRSLLGWRFAPSPEAPGTVAFSFRLDCRDNSEQRASPGGRTALREPTVRGSSENRGGVSYHERQRSGLAAGTLVGVSLGSALLGTGSYLLGKVLESAGAEETGAVFRIAGGCLWGLSGISVSAGAVVGIRLAARIRRARAQNRPAVPGR